MFHRRRLCTAAAATAAALGAALPAAAEICSAGSVPEVRFCGVDEFCCGRGCCPTSMLYFFKLSVAVLLLVMVLVWLCNYMRRSRAHAVSEHVVSLRPPPPPPLQPPLQPGLQPSLHLSMPPSLHPGMHLGMQPPPPPHDDLPPPYHTVVNLPASHTRLPSYSASCKGGTGPA